jgi:hypothetical protein
MHRLYAAGGDAAVRQHIRRRNVVRAQEERRRAAALAEPLRAPSLASDIERDLKALARAEADAANARKEANAARDRKDHKAHKAAVGREREAFGRIRELRKAISAARAKQLDARWATMAIGETEALSKARGESLDDEATEVSDWLRNEESGEKIIGDDGLPVLASERARARRANDRDPLKSLFKADRLTREQHETGQTVADLYRARSEGLGSQMDAIRTVSSPSRDNSAAIFNGVQRGIKLQRLGKIELAVATKCRAEPAALAMLRAVCGEGMSLSSQGEGRAFERNLTALKMALDVARKVPPKVAVSAQA